MFHARIELPEKGRHIHAVHPEIKMGVDTLRVEFNSLFERGKSFIHGGHGRHHVTRLTALLPQRAPRKTELKMGIRHTGIHRNCLFQQIHRFLEFPLSLQSLSLGQKGFQRFLLCNECDSDT